MDFFDLKTFGGFAIIGVIATMWNKIKGVIEWIVSIFLVTVKTDRQTMFALNLYCYKHYKYFTMNKYQYNSSTMYSNKFKRYLQLPYLDVFHNNGIYFYKWTPIFVGNNEDDSFFCYFRGTFNHQQLIKNSSDYLQHIYLQESNKNKQNIKRYSVYHVYGDRNIKENNEKCEAEVSNDLALLLKRGVVSNVTHNIEELGVRNKFTKPSLDFLYFPDHTLKNTIVDIEYWLEHEKWYKEKGISWKRGLLLFGQPGTGKTALSTALAEKYDLPLIVMHLETMTNQELMQLWKEQISYHTPCVILLEDIDNVFHGRQKAQQDMNNESVTFDCLLNVLDGAQKDDGYYLIITTNKIDQVDEALGIPRNGDNQYTISTRPGRIDRIVELPLLDENGRVKIAENLLSDTLDLSFNDLKMEQNNIDDYDMFHTLVYKDGKKDTPAQFVERCRDVAVKKHIQTNLVSENHKSSD